MVDWLTYSPTSGQGNGIITITADTLFSFEDRVAQIVASNSQYSLVDSVDVMQNGLSPEDSYYTLILHEGGRVEAHQQSAIDEPIYYRVNNGEWQEIGNSDWDYGYDGKIFNKGDVVNLKSNNTTYIKTVPNTTPGGTDYITYRTQFCAPKGMEVAGNIMSMFYGDNFIDKKTFPSSSSVTFTTQGTYAHNLVLPATALTYCLSYGLFPFGTYQGLFSGGFKTTPKVLPATTLTKYCYYGMFAETNITDMPIICATTVDDHSCERMFRDCKCLTGTTEFNFTNMNDTSSCCIRMFENCKSLFKSPDLKNTNIGVASYREMFSGCSSLGYITCLATSVPEQGTKDWVSGVAEEGVFVKNQNMSWGYGQSAIPIGWEVADYGYTSPVTAVTINDLTWVNDVPASGGTATSANCSFTVTAYYSDGTTSDITSSASIFSDDVIIDNNTANTRENVGVLNIRASYYGASILSSVDIYQEANSITGITFSGLTWVTDIPSSGGTATSENCAYHVYANHEVYILDDITSAASISGSLSVPATTASTRENVGVLTLTASYSGFSTNGSVTVYQAAPEIIRIDFNNQTWVTDIPASGGTADSGNCSFNIIAYYDNGEIKDVSNSATISGSVVIPESEIIIRHSAGTLTLTASYSGYSASTNITVYQEASHVLTEITIDNLTWVTNIPYYGGIATSANCTFDVTAHFNDASTEDVTAFATVNGSAVIPSSIIESVHSAGTLVLEASYEDKVATASTIIYQNAYENPSLTPLTFDIISSGTIYWKTTSSSFTKTISYSKDNGLTWNSITPTESGASISVDSGDEIMFRGNNSVYHNGMSDYNSFSSSTGTKFNSRGNIMSLVDENNYTGLTSISSNCFSSLFYSCTGLISVENLLLPITTLANSCYYGMFYGCTSLTQAPELPATTLAPYCYRSMFSNCTSLTQAPELPAQLLVTSCYEYMFNGCSSLNYIKCLGNDRDGGRTTNEWVSNVSTTGTFVKDSTMSWSSGTSGIPSGWTVIDAT